MFGSGISYGEWSSSGGQISFAPCPQLDDVNEIEIMTVDSHYAIWRGIIYMRTWSCLPIFCHPILDKRPVSVVEGDFLHRYPNHLLAVDGSSDDTATNTVISISNPLEAVAQTPMQPPMQRIQTNEKEVNPKSMPIPIPNFSC
jgi:hypothetical protein